MLKCTTLAVVAAASVVLPASLTRAAVFSDPGESLANYTITRDSATATDSTAAIIDYSTLGIAEAPRQIAGSAATTGIQLTANKGDQTAAITGINLLLGSTPISQAGDQTLSFDIYCYVPTGATSTTEGFLGGITRTSSTDAMMRNFRTARGNGAWFFLANDNGNTSDDYRSFNGSTIINTYTEATASPSFASTFTNASVSTTNDPANEWVKVDIARVGTTTTISLNGVQFSSFTTTNTQGYAWIGYEDFFGSVGTSGIQAIVDNVVLTPEPTTLVAVGGLGGLLVRRRRSR